MLYVGHVGRKGTETRESAQALNTEFPSGLWFWPCPWTLRRERTGLTSPPSPPGRKGATARMPKVFLKTYGCQMNERDSEQVARDLVARGYEMTGSEKDADVVLLNTCSVRDLAEQKALGKMGMLGRLRANRPEMVFGFLGCMAQSRGSELTRDMGHVDLVVGTQKFHRVAEYVDQIVKRRQELREQLMDDVRYSIVDVEEEAGSQES